MDERGRAYQVAECPRSATSEQAIDLVVLASQQLSAHETTGASMMPGPDIGKWPAWWYELVMAVAHRRNLRQKAELDARSRE